MCGPDSRINLQLNRITLKEHKRKALFVFGAHTQQIEGKTGRVEEELHIEVDNQADDGERAELLDLGHEGEEAGGENNQLSEKVLGDGIALVTEAMGEARPHVQCRRRVHDGACDA